MRRAWAAKHGQQAGDDPCASGTRLAPEHRSRVHAQLNALKRRAAFRSQKLAAKAGAAAPAAAAQAWHDSAEVFDSSETGTMDAAEAAASICGIFDQQADGCESGTTERGGSGESAASRCSDESASESERSRVEPHAMGFDDAEQQAQGSKGSQARSQFRSNSDQLRHQLAGLHRKAAFREQL